MNDELYSRYKKCGTVNCLSCVSKPDRCGFLISGSKGDRYMVVINKKTGQITCTCSDNKNRPNLWCKHILHILFVKTRIIKDLHDPIFSQDELCLTTKMMAELALAINKLA